MVAASFNSLHLQAMSAWGQTRDVDSLSTPSSDNDNDGDCYGDDVEEDYDAEYSTSDLPTIFFGVAVQRRNDGEYNGTHSYHDDTDEDDDSVTPPPASPPAAAPRHINTSASATSDGNVSTADDNRPPTPWGSSKAKEKIIEELKDETSDIYLSIGDYTPDNFNAVNFKQIQLKYADNKYKPSNFRESEF